MALPKKKTPAKPVAKPMTNKAKKMAKMMSAKPLIITSGGH